MKEMKKKRILKYSSILGIILGMMLLLLFSTIDFNALSTENDKKEDTTFLLNDGWDITIRGKEYKNVSLNKFTFPVVNKEEEADLKITLPEEINIESSTLTFMTIHTYMVVYLDKKEIYRYGQERFEQGKLLGYGYHYIELPKDCEGKELEIKLTCTENDAYAGFNKVKIINTADSYRDAISENTVAFALVVFLMIFGLSLLLISVIMSFYSRKFVKLISIAMFSICVGMWTMCNCDLIGVFGANLVAKTYMEYIFLYLMPVPAFWYFRDEVEECRNKPLRRVFYALEIYLVIYAVGSIFLNQFTDIHFPAVLRVFHISAIILILYLFIMLVYRKKRTNQTNNVLLIGMFVLSLVIGFEIIIFNVVKYTNFVTDVNFNSIICIGEYLFVLILIGDFCAEIKETVYDAARRKTLESIAYQDVMTDLYNRRKCEDIFDELDLQDKNYGIISIDLNDLKKTNDTKGHMMGDKLIELFGRTLKEYFKDFQCGRMGGDEFIVFIHSTDTYNLEKSMTEFETLLREKNVLLDGFQMSMAYGYAVSSKERSARDTYRLADERMYQKKIAMKKQR